MLLHQKRLRTCIFLFFPDKREALYSLAVIPAVLVLVIVILFLLKKRNEKKNTLAGQGTVSLYYALEQSDSPQDQSQQDG